MYIIMKKDFLARLQAEMKKVNESAARIEKEYREKTTPVEMTMSEQSQESYYGNGKYSND